MGRVRRFSALAASLAAASWLACGDRAATPSGAPLAGAAEAPNAAGRNRLPVIDSVRLEPQSPGAGEPIRAVVEASDADGDAIRIGYTWSVGGRTVSGDGSEIRLDGARKGDAVEVTVVAGDGRGESGPESAGTRVGNRAPTLDRVSIGPAQEVVAGTQLVVRPDARDPDGDPLEFRYTWRVNGATVAETGPALDTRRLRRGDTLEVGVVASDGEDESDAIRTSAIRITNAPPEILSTPSSDSSGAFHYRVEARDPDGDRTLRYRLVQAPKGMSIDAIGGELTWRPGADQSGAQAVEVAVDDSQGGTATQRFELSVSAEEPAKTSPPAAPAEAGAEGEDESGQRGVVSATHRGPGRARPPKAPSPAAEAEPDE